MSDRWELPTEARTSVFVHTSSFHSGSEGGKPADSMSSSVEKLAATKDFRPRSAERESRSAKIFWAS